jgi:phage gp36-like protein
MYSTTPAVREAAGFTGNLNISTASISRSIAMADGIINGKLYDVYTLPLSEVPAMIGGLSEELAAALLLIDEYGTESDGTERTGETRYTRVMSVLTKIQNREIKVVSDTTGTELARASTLSPRSLPNDITNAERGINNTAPKVRMNDTF